MWREPTFAIGRSSLAVTIRGTRSCLTCLARRGFKSMLRFAYRGDLDLSEFDNGVINRHTSARVGNACP
jgi:hypothetical protein